jgi:hypothetical protein
LTPWSIAATVTTRDKAQERVMEFGIFNLMGSRDPAKPTAEVFAEVAEQTRRADELGYTIAWFAEHYFSNYCLCASPLMLVAHCAPITKKIRLGTAVVVLPLYNPARLAAEYLSAPAAPAGWADGIITNPHYSSAQEFAEKAISYSMTTFAARWSGNAPII